jgi:arylformamidase
VRIQDYPPQEPLSPAGAAYAAEVMRRRSEAGVAAHEEPYGADPYQRLAIHTPPGAATGDVLAFVHGGGWTGGYKEHMDFIAPCFTGSGTVFVSIGYRLAPDHVFPEGLDDVAAAIAWLFANVARFGGDPGRLFIGGHSAGGHYTALLGVRRDWQAALGLPPDVVRGCLPLSGVYDFTEGSGLAQRPRFLGAAGAERTASPVHNIAAPPVPFLIAHGGDDFPHLMRQAAEFETALGAAGGDVARIELAGRDHFTACYAAGEPDGPWVAPARRWMSEH